ncbi:MAG: outer membrane lipoprotein-sorting protein [Firmicutes bacterium]|jgi:outer membrane lipoprotein-sorting protein|nr:outer membrane lipoprotein-sorting protein [Bacillota bacterium]
MKRLLILGLLVALASSAAGASGEEILARLDETMQSNSREVVQKMTLVSAKGQERTRQVQMWSKTDRMLVRFLAPADVAGTGLLSVGDDMWLYLPALGRVRRIAGHAKKGSFMGTDLSYEDMEEFGKTGFAAAYSPELIKMEEEFYLLRLTPRSQDRGYQYLEMKVCRERFLPLRIEYYAPDGSLAKVLTTMDFQEVQGRPTASKLIVEDVAKGSKTILEQLQVDFEPDMDEEIFSTRYLERGR